MLETSCGSPHYASPEIVSGKRYKGTASDIWSCGIILFALLCGRLPFDDPNIQLLLGKVRAGKFMMPEWLEPASKDLIWRMLEVDPEKRIKMSDIMRHPWFTTTARSRPSTGLNFARQLADGAVDARHHRRRHPRQPQDALVRVERGRHHQGAPRSWSQLAKDLLHSARRASREPLGG